jgi:hypothetical protein
VFEVPMRVNVATMVSVALLSSMVAAQTASGECVKVGVRDFLGQHADRIFLKGTTLSVTPIGDPARTSGFKVTFDVERVWKGSVSKRVELYVDLKADNPQFQLGHSAIFAATVLGDAARRLYGIIGTDTPAYAPIMCSDLFSESEITDALGAGNEPKEAASRGSWVRASPVDDNGVRSRFHATFRFEIQIPWNFRRS